jgi:hypothetical protein
MNAPAQKRRRRALLAWIPAGILLIIIAAVFAVTVVVLQDEVGTAPTTAPPNAVDVNGASLFTEAGRDYISDTRRVRLDVRQLPVDAGSIGLGDNETFELTPSEDVYVYLEVFAPTGRLKFTGTTLSIAAAGGVLADASITDEARRFTFSQTRSLVASRAQLYGFPEGPDGAILALEAAAAEGGEGDEPYTLTLRSEDTFGVAVEMNVSCTPAGFCFVEYVVGLD